MLRISHKKLIKLFVFRSSKAYAKHNIEKTILIPRRKNWKRVSDRKNDL